MIAAGQCEEPKNDKPISKRKAAFCGDSLLICDVRLELMKQISCTQQQFFKQYRICYFDSINLISFNASMDADLFLFKRGLFE
jgi:hypothetical protein